MNTPLFKTYNQNQILLLPPSLEELIAANHPVRVVNEVINSIDIDAIIKKYKGGGTTSYHPCMLLKALVYAYLNNVYSSRKIEAALKENIHFMWLAGMSTPDHHTINRFRSERLTDILKEIFAQIVLLLVESGHVSLKEVYTDGTKIEANANRYTFVWGNAIKASKERIKKQLHELWAYTQAVAAEEMDDDTPPDFDKIDSEKVKQTIEKIDAALKDKPVNKSLKQKLNYAKKNWPANLEKYKQHEQILGERNSYSKTDPDATFMRLKEDHMKNGQLKPGYNLQISTHNQIVTNYTIHQTTNDTNTLEEHLQSFEQLYNENPEMVITDAGFGSDENYQALEQRGIEAYVKYNYFDKEQKQGYLENHPFHYRNLHYNEGKDIFICPMGQAMHCIGSFITKNKNGHQKQIKKYQAHNCNGCPLRGACHKQKTNRIIEVNHRLRKYKQRVRENLISEKGKAYRKQRPCDVEPVFANIKCNKNFRRFILRSKPKVEIEVGLVLLAHNLSKIAA